MQLTSEFIEGIWLTNLRVSGIGTQAQHADLKTSILRAHEKMLKILFTYKNAI